MYKYFVLELNVLELEVSKDISTSTVVDLTVRPAVMPVAAVFHLKFKFWHPVTVSLSVTVPVALRLL